MSRCRRSAADRHSVHKYPSGVTVIQVRRFPHHEVPLFLHRRRRSLHPPRPGRTDLLKITRHHWHPLLRRVPFRQFRRPNPWSSVCISSTVLSFDLTDHFYFSFLSKYVDRQTAQQYNLTYATNDAFVLRADYTTYLMPSDSGRKSVRLVSYNQFSTFVAMYVHRPLHRTLHNHISLASTYVTCQ